MHGDKEDIPMADNKQYITQIQEHGTIMISEEVVAVIVTQAIKDVEGVVTLNVKPGAPLADRIGVKNWGKGMKIEIAEDNSLTVVCDIMIGYNQSVVTVAKAVQDAVTAALESMTGVKVNSVNINVCGIIRQ